MKKIKNVLKVFAGNAMVAGVPLITLPLTTSIMSVADFGLFSMAQIIIAFFIPFVGMSLATNYGVNYYALSAFKRSQLLSSGLTMTLLLCVIFECVLVFLVYFSGIKTIGGFESVIVFLFPIFASFKLCSDLGMVDLRYREKFSAYFLAQLSNSSLIIISILVIWNLDVKNWLYIWSAYYFVYCLISVIMFVTHYKVLKFKYSLNLKVIKDIIYFGGKYIPHVLGVTLISMGDRFFIGLILGEQDLGLYSAAFQISATTYIVFYSINQVWSQSLFRRLSTGVKVSSTIKPSLFIFMLFIIVILGLFLINPFLFPVLVTSSFVEAQDLVLPIAIAFLAQGGYFLMSNYLLFDKKTGVIASFTLIASVLNCGLNIVFINKFGIAGAPFATVASWIFVMVLMFIQLKKNHVYRT